MLQPKMPVSDQAAMLTEEQRKNVEIIFKICIIISIVALVLIFGIMLVCLLLIDDLDSQIESTLTFNAYRKFLDLYDQRDQLYTIMSYSTIGVLVVYAVIYFSVYFTYKKKYPYYSEKMYFAVRKLRKQEEQDQMTR